MYVKVLVSHEMRNKLKGGKCMVNVPKLKGKIVECSTTVEELSQKLNIDKSTFYRKMNDNGDTFTVKEVDGIVKNLNLTLDEANSIFFNQFVAYNANK